MTKGYEQRKAANERYLLKLDQVQVRMQKGKKCIITAHAEQRGESVNAFINRAIDEAMERDKQKHQ